MAGTAQRTTLGGSSKNGKYPSNLCHSKLQFLKSTDFPQPSRSGSFSPQTYGDSPKFLQAFWQILCGLVCRSQAAHSLLGRDSLCPSNLKMCCWGCCWGQQNPSKSHSNSSPICSHEKTTVTPPSAKKMHRPSRCLVLQGLLCHTRAGDQLFGVAHGHLAQAMVQWIGGGNLQETMGFWPQIQGDPADFHTNSGIMVTSPELRYDQPTSDSGTAPSSGLVNIKVGCCGSFHHRVKVFCFLDHGS